MRNCIIRRALLMVPTLFLVSVVVFLGIRLIPGGVVETMALEMGQRTSTGGQVDIEAMEEMLGMNTPIHVRYGQWIGGIFRGVPVDATPPSWTR